MTRRTQSFLAVLGVTTALLALAGPAGAAVTAEPDSLMFTSQDQSATVELTSNGNPVPASAITSTSFRVDTHTYDHMISVAKHDGSIVITPTKALEMGWYDLDVHTSDGNVTVRVFAPLGGVKDTVEKQAAALGMSVDAYRVKYGLATTGEPQQIFLDLAPVYYEGQALTAAVTGNEDANVTWRINGEVVKQGVGDNSLHYVPTKPGDLILSYMAQKDGKTVAAATAATEVLPLPAVLMTTNTNTEVTFQGPAGYSDYAWTVDGTVVGHEQNYVRKFETPGTYTVECVAKKPTSTMTENVFQHITYRVTVTAAM